VFTSIAAAWREPLLQAGRLVGRLVIEAGGAEHHQFHLARFDAGRGQRAARRHFGQIGQPHMRDAPFADAGARDDPLVTGVEEGGEVCIGEGCGRQALAPPRYGRVRHARILAGPERRPD
jgi:hypothetical protein